MPRIHQEDFCQALGVLARLSAFNPLAAGVDAHAKNHSLLLSGGSAWRSGHYRSRTLPR